VEGGRLRIADRAFDLDRLRRLVVVGAGKASARMALALEELLGDRITKGAVSVKYGHGEPLRRVRVFEAGHPVPDEAGVRAARDILAAVEGSTPEDLVIALISGGGSALLPLPAQGITLEQKQRVTEELLRCGATIHELNAVRKHLSAVKGGGLARAASPAPVVALLLSDVVGDDPDVIASGPTVADRSRFEDAVEIVRQFGLEERLPEAVTARLRRGARGEIAETAKPGDRDLGRCVSRVIGSNRRALLAAADAARSLGHPPLILSSSVEGEARDVAGVHASIAAEVVRSGHPVPAPACLLSGGETTVTVRGAGRGGRNTEFVLAAAIALGGLPGVVVLSAGTDGTDGPTDAAGAIADPGTLERARAAGLDARAHLAANDSHTFFEREGGLVLTGPTNTNVMDVRVLLVASDPGIGAGPKDQRSSRVPSSSRPPGSGER